MNENSKKKRNTALFMVVATVVNIVLMTVFMLIGMALMGLTFGIQSALLPELFPTNVRYTGSAISYNVASILGGGNGFMLIYK